MEKIESFAQGFDEIDQKIAVLEQRVAESKPGLAELLADAVPVMRRLLTAFAQFDDKEIPETDDLLEVFKAFVKGDPSLNSVRDNVRELVYYQNCLAMGREDALPKAPERMVVRTLRHVYLYLRSRAEQDGRFG